MSETILVTGADGFIGTRLVSALRQNGNDVRTHSAGDGDIADFDSPARPAAVVHLAARSFVPDSWIETADYYRVNVLGTIRVLEFCRRRGARLVYISTYVYGEPSSLPITEEHARTAASPYHHSKILAEDACAFYAEQFQVPVAIVRPFNIYGPGQDPRFIIPVLIRQAFAPDATEISVADLRPRRDYLYITDFIRFLVSVLEHRATGTYNVGSGVSISIADLLEQIGKVAGVQKPVISRDEFRKNEILDVRACIDKARRDLDWSPLVSLAEGLSLTRDFLAAAPAAPADHPE